MKHLRTFAAALTLTVTLLGATSVARAGFNNALSFDGSSQYVSVPGFGNIIPTGEVTVEFWAYANAIGQNSAFMLQPDDINNRFQAHISFDNGNTYWDFGDINTSGRILNGNPPNTVSNWVHYALVASQGGNFMKIYTNGNLFVSQTGMTPFIRGDYELRIGGGDYKLNGRLDDFRVWSVARSQAEIQASYTAPLNGNEANLLVYYRFDSASGTLATNSATATGAAYDGTLVNSPVWGSSGVLTMIVSNANDSGPGSLRQAIESAPSGATITFDASLSGATIPLTNGVTLNNITIDASALANGITINIININGKGHIFSPSGTTNVLTALNITGSGRVVNNTGSLTLNQCTVGGNTGAVDGSGIDNYNGTLAMNQCTVSGNTATATGVGGGIFNFSGTLTMTQCTVSGNTADYGGGIYNTGTMTMNQCTVSGNTTTGFGGGIFNFFGTLTMTQCTVSGNTANEDGGGIYSEQGTLTMTQCTVSGNTAGEDGGGIYNVEGTLTMNQCTVSGNTTTDGHGGGIYNSDGTLMMTQCTVSGNTASDRAGGIYSTTDGDFTSNFTSLTNCTIAGNTANGTGGGIRNNNGLTTLTFCTVSGNTSPDGAGAWTYGDSTTRTAVNDSIIAGNTGTDVISQDGNALSFISGGYNLIGSGDNSYFNQSGDVVNLTGVGLLAPLANYGGPTMTMPPLPGSPAIDAAIGATLTTDQRGFLRPVDGDTNGVAVADIGAVEFAPLPPLAGSYNGLFFETAGVVHEHSGFFTAKLAATRKFSSKLMFAGKKYSLSGQFDGTGKASNSIPRTGLSPLTVKLYSLATNEIFGLVSDGNWTAALNSDRAVFNKLTNPCPQAAKYTMNIPGGNDSTTSPQGFGFGTVAIDAAGKITLKGLLADGTKIGQKTLLSKDGQWPLYVPIKSGGSVMSWVSVSSATPKSFNGDLVWTKKANPLAKTYPLGFTNMTGINGSRYVAPAVGTRILVVSREAYFDGANFDNYIVPFTLGTDNKVTSSTVGFSLKFKTATGLFSGKVTDPVTLQAVTFAGAVDQNRSQALGFFLQANQSGWVFTK